MPHCLLKLVRRVATLGALVSGLLALGLHAAQADQPLLAGYLDDQAFADAVQKLAKNKLVSIQSLAKTRGGRDLWAISIAKGDPAAKPAILIVGGAHAPHVVGSELALRLAQRLAAVDDPAADREATQRESLNRLLDRFTFYVIPRPNPDATAACFRQPYEERATNETPIDDDRDGAIDEDPSEDLNGDGLITMLRIEDPSGEYLPSPLDPRVLIKADPARGEVGRYRLITEGIDNDHDELFNEDPPGGVSFNRNFTAHYPFFGLGAGPSQVSEIETRAFADFAFSHANIALVFSFAPEDNLIEAWKKPEKPERFKFAPLPDDADRLGYLAERYRGDRDFKGAPESPAGDGSVVRWAYSHFGRWSLGARAWWPPQVPGKEKAAVGDAKPVDNKDEATKTGAEKTDARTAAEKKREEDTRGVQEANALRWFEREGIDGFVAWTPLEHPDFPGQKVEVGGFKPFRQSNPPAAELDSLAKRHCDYLTSLADLASRLKIEQAKVEPLGNGVFRLSVKVVNTGYLPTEPEITSWAEKTQTLQIKLSTPDGVQLVTGTPRTRLDRLAGGAGVEKSWVLRSSAAGAVEVQVTVYAPAVGSETITLPLK
jgi:hypothetical protein